MKQAYTLLAALALFAGCGAVPTQSSASHDIAQMIDAVQRGVDLSMTLPVNVGSGSDVDRAIAEITFSKYKVAENRVENGITNTDIAVVDEVS
jgi:uncharacterized lipoprotein YajG